MFAKITPFAVTAATAIGLAANGSELDSAFVSEPLSKDGKAMMLAQSRGIDAHREHVEVAPSVAATWTKHSPSKVSGALKQLTGGAGISPEETKALKEYTKFELVSLTRTNDNDHGTYNITVSSPKLDELKFLARQGETFTTVTNASVQDGRAVLTLDAVPLRSGLLLIALKPGMEYRLSTTFTPKSQP